jgi:hypothetical protein
MKALALSLLLGAAIAHADLKPGASFRSVAQLVDDGVWPLGVAGFGYLRFDTDRTIVGLGYVLPKILPGSLNAQSDVGEGPLLLCSIRAGAWRRFTPDGGRFGLSAGVVAGVMVPALSVWKIPAAMNGGALVEAGLDFLAGLRFGQGRLATISVYVTPAYAYGRLTSSGHDGEPGLEFHGHADVSTPTLEFGLTLGEPW